MTDLSTRAGRLSYLLRSGFVGMTTLRHLPRRERRQVRRAFLALKARAAVAAVLFPERPAARQQVLGLQLTSADSYLDFDYLFEEMFIRRPYDVLPPSDEPMTVVDCGANIGMATAFFVRQFPAATVIAFEPDPLTFDQLRRNVEANGMSQVELHPVALGRENTLGTLADPNHIMNSQRQHVLANGSAPGGPGAVEIRKLSEILGDRRVDLLKLDVEGAELDILRDLESSGSLERVQNIVAEVDHEPKSPDGHMPEFLKMLERNGFSYQVDTLERRLVELGVRQQLLVRAYR